MSLFVNGEKSLSFANYYGIARYPPFMVRKSGQLKQQRVWEETRDEFITKVPEVRAIYEILDGK